MAKRNKRDVVLERYFKDLKFIEFSDFKKDPSLLHKLFDQYHKAVEILHKQKRQEDETLNKLY